MESQAAHTHPKNTHSFCAMNSNNLLKNFPTKRWGKVIYRRISSCGSVTCSFRKDLLRICVFPSHLWVSDITELIKQLLKLYEALSKWYSECVNWLEEDRNDNIVFDANLNPSTKAMQGQEQGRGSEFLSRKIEGLRDLGFTWSKIAKQPLLRDSGLRDKFYMLTSFKHLIAITLS